MKEDIAKLESPDLTYHNMNNGKDYVIKTYVHTHPYSDCPNNQLCISDIDIENFGSYNNEINILLLDGSFYRQSTLSGQSLYIPNYRGNIYDKSFKY